MPVAIITGSGTHALPGLRADRAEAVTTPYGDVEVSSGTFADAEVLHLSRHGAGHERLSSHVTHRANVWALRSLGATAVLACTACGALDPALELGSLVVFDDLHFTSNRLPDGSLCTFFESGDPARGHWVLHGGPFSEDVRRALVAAAADTGRAARAGGTYGHVDGPRFNTPSEIASLAAAGVTAVSQTAGPECVLCGELELPYGLVGYVTDYANEVVPSDPTPVATLTELMRTSTAVFADVLGATVRRLAVADHAPAPAGTMLRLGHPS
jgi:purine nucleoside phosphorylase